MDAAVRLFDPEEFAPSPRKRRKLPVWLTEPQEALLIQFATDQLARAKQGTRRYGPNQRKIRAAERDLFLAHFGLGTGLRLDELCHLLVVDVDLVAGHVVVQHGKGDKRRYVPLSERLWPITREWIGRRRDGYVFTDDGEPFCRGTLYSRITRLGRRAGLPMKIHPHTMRHTFATRVYAATRDILVVQMLLGHESVATTQIYAHCDLGIMREAVNSVRSPGDAKV